MVGSENESHFKTEGLTRMKFPLAAAAFMALGLSACSTGEQPQEQGASAQDKPMVLASFYPVADMAERIAGDAATVTNLTPAGVEPHDLELSPDQVELVRDADLALYVGNGFSPAVEQAADQRTGAKVNVLEGLALDQAEAHEDAHDHGDAAEEHAGEGANAEASDVDVHFWLDPALMIDVSRKVETALQAAAPDEAAAIATRAEAYRADMQALDNEYREALSNCDRDVIVTSHSAFHYPAKRYGFEQHSIALDPDSEPTAGDLDKLTDVIKSEGVPVVFSETLVSPRIAETLAREAGVRVETLNPLEGLTSEQIAEGANYDSIMRTNLASLRNAMACR